MSRYQGPICDPHMHMWDLGRARYNWLQDDPLPNNPAGDVSGIAHRNYLPADYLAEAAGWNIVSTVHVECGRPLDDQPGETDWLEAQAAATGLPTVIVAGATLQEPGIADRLAQQAERGRVRGVRQIVNWHRDPLKTYNAVDWLEDESWRAGLKALEAFDLSFDLQIYPSQMATAARIASRNPDLRFVLNHCGMPTDQDADGIALWRTGMRLLAEQPNVACKISGLGGAMPGWTVDAIRPFVMHAIECFGVNRAMFASNFPVDRVHGAFSAHWSAFSELTADLSADERAALFCNTAETVYRIVR